MGRKISGIDTPKPLLPWGFAALGEKGMVLV